MKFEYIALTDSNKCICKDADAFNRLLLVNSNISIVNNKLIYTENKLYKIEVEYEIISNNVKSKSQKYFHIKVTYNNSKKTDLEYERLNLIRKIIFANLTQLNKSVSVNTLWNDISIFYASKAYPYINRIENLMRKFILKFMCINIGFNWFDEAIPFDIREQISQKKTFTNKNKYQNPLFEADFIHLSKIILDKYRISNIQNIDTHIDKLLNKEDIDFSKLQTFLLQSNWDRYFKRIFPIDDSFIKKNWTKLYDYRIKIAHNKDFTKSDYQDVKRIVLTFQEKVFNNMESNFTKKEELITSYDFEFSPKITKLFSEKNIITINQLTNVKYKNIFSNKEQMEIDDFLLIANR